MQKKTSFKLTCQPNNYISGIDFARFIKNYVEPYFPGVSCDKLPNWDLEADGLRYAIFRHNTSLDEMLKLQKQVIQRCVDFLHENGDRSRVFCHQFMIGTTNVGNNNHGYITFDISTVDEYVASEDGRLIATVPPGNPQLVVKTKQPDGSYYPINETGGPVCV